MITASQRIYALAGSPPHDGCAEREPFLCWVCGGDATRGLLRSEWMAATFVGQNRARALASSYVCEACAHCMAGQPPDTLRMKSQLVDDRGWLQFHKGHKPAIRAWLREPKKGEWLAAIADTGQKHVVPWTPINPAGTRDGRVLFEERLVTLGDWTMVDALTALLTAGATKEETVRGEYGPRAWQLAATEIRDFETRFGARERGGGWFELAVWLAQRDEVEVEKRMAAEKTQREEKKNAGRDRKGKSAKPHRGDAARDPSSVPTYVGSKHAEALGHAPIANAERGAHERERRGVVDGHGEVAADRRAQCELFGVPSPPVRSRPRKGKGE